MLVLLLQSDDLELWFQAMREPSDDGEEVEEDMEEDVDTSKLNVSSNHTHSRHRGGSGEWQRVWLQYVKMGYRVRYH